MKFVRYNGNTAVIAMNGQELTDEHPGSDLSDHLGLWFGDVTEDGRPIIYTIPAEYVGQAEMIPPDYRH
jgi:ABC-type glycerol-3-phosphate transport system substrate-binding protein